jgi:Phytanoyl-CoA dioxygenase (PhyH)
VTAVMEFKLLPESNVLLSDPQALNDRWERDGVLFFRDVINPAAVARVRDEYLKGLASQDLIAQTDGHPSWTGRTPPVRNPLRDLDDQVWRSLVQDPSFDGLVRSVLGDAPCWLPIVEYRATVPGTTSDDLVAGRHQDAMYNAGIGFRICWVPLIDIDMSIGGLALAVGTHRQGYLHDLDDPPRFPIPGDAIPPGVWHRADYHPGDVVIFHDMLAHTGLPNVTDDVVRMSIDLRVLPASARQPVIGKIAAIDTSSVVISTDDDLEVRLTIDDQSFLRAMVADRAEKLTSDQIVAALPVGSRVIAGTDGTGRATVVRPTT